MSDIQINMLTDPVCPWCYIGRERLRQAMQERPQYRFSLNYLPYQLNPTMAQEGMDRKAYLYNKFGGKRAADAAYAPVYEAADNLRLGFNLDLIETMPNSTDAHILLQYLQQQGYDATVCDAFLESLFQAFFCEGKNIGSYAVLNDLWLRLAADNLPKAEELLKHKAYRDYIREAQNTAMSAQIGGVPFYIIGGKYSLSGAQESQMFLPIFDLASQ